MSLTEILVVVVLVLVVLGPEKIPELMRWMGRVTREVRRATNMFQDTMMMEEDLPGQGPLDMPEAELQTPSAASEPTTSSPSGSQTRMYPVYLDPALPTDQLARDELDLAGDSDQLRRRYLSPPHRELHH